jgi:flagellar biosynthesis GTPase FlhF
LPEFFTQWFTYKDKSTDEHPKNCPILFTGLQCSWPTFSTGKSIGKGVGSILSNAQSNKPYCFLPTVIHELEKLFKNCLEGYITWTTRSLEESLLPESKNEESLVITEIDNPEEQKENKEQETEKQSQVEDKIESEKEEEQEQEEQETKQKKQPKTRTSNRKRKSPSRMTYAKPAQKKVKRRPEICLNDSLQAFLSSLAQYSFVDSHSLPTKRRVLFTMAKGPCSSSSIAITASR